MTNRPEMLARKAIKLTDCCRCCRLSKTDSGHRERQEPVVPVELIVEWETDTDQILVVVDRIPADHDLDHNRPRHP